jgi:hypothetical protein
MRQQMSSPLSQAGTPGTAHRPGLFGPPVLWAAFGAACALFQLWVAVRWVADGNLYTYRFDGPMPTYLRVSTQVLLVVATGMCAVMAVVCWRGSRRAGHVTLSAALFTGYFLSFWSDPYSGTLHQTASNNLYGIAYPTWGPYLPGWQGPTPQAQSLLENLGYPWVVIWIWMGLGIARWLRIRRPAWSRARTAWITAAVMFPVDIVLEHAYMRFGGYGYSRALPYFTLFEGEWYQLPLFSPAIMTFCAVMPVVVMRLYARPGAEVWLLEGSLGLPRRVRPWVRLLAGVGFANACMLSLQLVVFLASLVSYPIELPPWYERPTG